MRRPCDRFGQLLRHLCPADGEVAAEVAGLECSTAVVVPFIGKAYGDAVLSKGPDLLDQAVVELTLPFAREECFDGVAAL